MGDGEKIEFVSMTPADGTYEIRDKDGEIRISGRVDIEIVDAANAYVKFVNHEHGDPDLEAGESISYDYKMTVR